MPTMVIRPVMASMAGTTLLNRRKVLLIDRSKKGFPSPLPIIGPYAGYRRQIRSGLSTEPVQA
jgi:hypothetical protein